jgi:signal transduction histidine kinase
METFSGLDPHLQAAEETVHMIAQRIFAIDSISRSLITGANSGGRGHGRPYEESRESLFRVFRWRIQNGQLSFGDVTNIAEVILREADYFKILISNLVSYMSQSEPLALRRRREPLRPLVEEVVDLFDFIAERKGVEIHLFMAEDMDLFIDRDLIQRLLTNLVDNAVKYSYSGSSEKSRFISIVCKRHSPEGAVAITMASYGVGILDEELQGGQIFKYGFRGKLARDRERRGMGVGLAESLRIAEAHGGTISVKSIHKHGETYLTTVKIILPPQ